MFALISLAHAFSCSAPSPSISTHLFGWLGPADLELTVSSIPSADDIFVVDAAGEPVPLVVVREGTSHAVVAPVDPWQPYQTYTAGFIYSNARYPFMVHEDPSDRVPDAPSVRSISRFHSDFTDYVTVELFVEAWYEVEVDTDPSFVDPVSTAMLGDQISVGGTCSWDWLPGTPDEPLWVRVREVSLGGELSEWVVLEIPPDVEEEPAPAGGCRHAPILPGGVLILASMIGVRRRGVACGLATQRCRDARTCTEVHSGPRTRR